METDKLNSPQSLGERAKALLSSGEALPPAVEQLLQELADVEHVQLPSGDETIRALLNASTDVALLMDPSGVILAANDELARRLGREGSHLTGISIYTMIAQELSERLKKRVEEVVRTCNTFIKEDKHDELVIRNSLYPVMDSSGSVAAVAIYGRDITENMRYQEELDYSRRSYEAIFNASTDCIFIHDGSTGEIVEINKAAEEAFGWTLEEMQNLNVGDMTANVPPFTHKEAFEHIQRAVSEGPQKFEWLAKNRNGELMWFENSLQYTKLAGLQRVMVAGRDITHRKNVEKALKESERKFRSFIENANDLIFTVSPNGSFTYVSPNWLEFMGEPAENAVGINFQEYVFPDDLPHCFEFHKKILSTGEKPEAIEYRVRRKDGSWRWQVTTGAPLFDSEGRITESLGIARDVTILKQAEEALRDSESRLRESQKTARIGHVEFKVETGEVLCSDMTYELYEGDPERAPLTYEEVIARHSSEDGDRLAKAMQDTLDTGKGYAIDLRVGMPSGRVAYHHVIGTPIRDETGRVTRVTGTVQDITQRKMAEIRQQDLASELEEILNSLPDAVVYADTQRRIKKVNPAFTKIFGYRPEEVLGKKTRIIYRSDEEYLEQGHKRYNTEVTQKWEPYEIYHVRKDGTEFITEAIGTPVRNAHGYVVGLLGLVKDLTVQKQMQERMRQMEKMESVGRLAGGVAHDFNNMLSVILGQTELAISTLEADSPLRENLEEVKKAGERSANLTRQLLAFARRQTVAPKVLDLNEIISSTLKMLERLIGEDINLIWKPGNELVPVKIDPGQVDQILANLAINARDAIGHNPGTVTMETDNTSFTAEYCSSNPVCSPGEYVKLVVRDNGCGMDEEIRSHIFEPFFTTKSGEQGTGLGLATIYGIVKQNDGFIDVSSVTGEGTDISIYLPCYLGKKPASHEDHPTTHSERGSETILLVEDEPAILKMTTMMLELEGYTVIPADTPGKAIRKAREHAGNIHLLLSDVVMPEMNGRDLARNILSLYPDIKRLFMSGYTADVIAHRGVLDEGVNFLQKPFSKNKLVAGIHEILNRDQ